MFRLFGHRERITAAPGVYGSRKPGALERSRGNTLGRLALATALTLFGLVAIAPPPAAFAAPGTPTSIGTNKSTSAVTSISPSTGSAAASAGSTVFVAVALPQAPAVTVTVTDSASNTYSKDNDEPFQKDVTDGIRAVVFSASNVTTTSGSAITVSLSSLVGPVAVSALTVSGLALYMTTDQTAKNGDSSTGAGKALTLPNDGSLTTDLSFSNELSIAVYGVTGGTGAVTGFTNSYTAVSNGASGTASGAGATTDVSVIPTYLVLSGTTTSTRGTIRPSKKDGAGVLVTYRPSPDSPVWGSFTTACTTATTTFGGTANAVCVRGSPFSSTHPTSYKVRLYDGNGNLVSGFVQNNVSAATLASGLVYAFQTGDMQGIWHAVVFDNAATPPPTYSSITSNAQQRANSVAVIAAFNLNSTPVPELPTVLAALAAALTIGTSYAFLRQRMRLDDAT